MKLFQKCVKQTGINVAHVILSSVNDVVFHSYTQVVGLNFSSATTPELMLKTFDHYCEYRKTPNGVVLSPVQLNKWLVLFCDEINLPDMDKYGR